MPPRRRTAAPAAALFAATLLLLGARGAALAQEAAGAAATEGATVPAPLAVGVADVPPFAMKASDRSWDGVAVHLWRDVADALDLTYDLVEVDGRGAAVEGVADGSLDVALTAVATAEGEARVDFAHPYYVASLGVAGSRLRSLADIAGQIVSTRFLRIVLALSGLLLVIGFLVWLVERRANAEEFGGGGSAVRGIGAGFWWAGVTMTTIGYGDKAPVTFLGRALALLWMLVAMGVTASLTAAIVAAVGTGSAAPIEVPGDLRGGDLTVGAVPGTSTAAYLERERIRYQAFDTAAAGLRAAAAGEVDAFVHSAPVLQYLAGEIDGGASLRVRQTRAEPQPFAFVLPERSGLGEPLDRLILERVTAPAWRDLIDRYMPEREG